MRHMIRSQDRGREVDSAATVIVLYISGKSWLKEPSIIVAKRQGKN